MRASTIRREHEGRRLLPPTGTGGLGVVVVVLLMALSSAAPITGASPSYFRNGSYSGSDYVSHGGCASVRGPTPSWSKSTGLGKISVSAQAVTCPKRQGGTAFTSDAGAEPELTVLAPVHPPNGVGGVNVSWAIKFAATLNYSTPSSPRCPTITYADDNYYSSWYNYSSGFAAATWYNVTELLTECVVESEVQLTATAAVQNLSGGPTIGASNSWYVAEYIYSQIYALSYWDNFSNPVAGTSSHYTSGAPVTTSSGTNPTSWTGSYSPKFFMNSSAYSTAFWSKSKYEVVTDVQASVYVDVYKFGHSSATVSFNSPTISQDVRLLPFQVW